MLVCGLSGRPGRGAAALVADGVLVAAASDQAAARPGRHGGRLPRGAIDACLRAVGASWRDVGDVVLVAGNDASTCKQTSGAPRGAGGSRAAWHRRSRVAAHAAIAHAAIGAVPAVVADGGRAAIAFPAAPLQEAPRLGALLRRLPALARALDAATDVHAAIPALELLAANADRADRRDWFEDWSRLHTAEGADERAFAGVLAAAQAAAGGRLDDVDNPHVVLQRVRAELAESLLGVVARAAADELARAGGDAALAGSAWRSPDFVDRVRAHAGRAVPVAPWAMADGAAVGAALCLAGPGTPLAAGLGLGPPATEPEAKAVLENCRLDYVYEPRWPRLMERVSKVLERGRLVAWFQGRAEFGDSLAGSRSILCDPSSRYARDNVNQFLRGVPLATPVPVSLAPLAGDCVDGSLLSPWAFARAQVHADWLQALRAGVDAHGRGHVHVAAAETTFGDLLEVHRQRTGVPGLVNLPLAGPDRAAHAARDAVRVAFASSVDVLVLHRFVVVKDYWQMRGDV
jgi:carbamoyltransferase